MAKNNTSNIKGYTIEVITPVPSVPFPEMPTVIFLFIPPDIFYANHVYTSIYMGVYVCVHMHLISTGVLTCSVSDLGRFTPP